MLISDVQKIVNSVDAQFRPKVIFFDSYNNEIKENQPIVETTMGIITDNIQKSIAIVKCVDESKQEEYESRLINGYILGQTYTDYLIIIHNHHASFTNFMNTTTGIIYIREKSPYQVDDDQIYFVHQDLTHISNNIHLIKLKMTDLGILRLPKEHYVEWLDRIEDMIDLYKNPINKPHWNDVYFQEAPYGTYESKRLFIIPGLRSSLIKFESSWIKVDLPWIKRHIDLMPKDIQHEFALMKNLEEIS